MNFSLIIMLKLCFGLRDIGETFAINPPNKDFKVDLFCQVVLSKKAGKYRHFHKQTIGSGL